MSSDFKCTRELIELRRSKVLELSAQGYSQVDIAHKLNVSTALISLDLQYIREQARDNLKSFIQEKLPEEVEKAFTSYNYIIKIAYQTAENTSDDRIKDQALRLLKDTTNAKIDLVSNVDIINKVMDMARSNSERLLQNNSNNTDEDVVTNVVEDSSNDKQSEDLEQNADSQ